MKTIIELINETIDENPPISELENGIYKGMFYCWVFELEDGRKFKTNVGIKRPRQAAPLEDYEIKDGKIHNI